MCAALENLILILTIVSARTTYCSRKIDLEASPAFASCWDVVGGTNYSEFLNFTAQTSVANGTYLFTCTDCNNYPILPDCIADSALVQDSFTWPVPTGSLHIMVALCSILAYFL